MPSPLQVYMASRQFARAANIDPLDIANAATFYVKSKSRPGQGYWMRHTPEGVAVHVGEGCEAEQFLGPFGCWHSKQMKIEGEEMTSTAVVPVENSAVSMPEFSDEQLKTIANVICVNSKGERAPDSFVQLFLAASRRAGLDPFLKQIWAMQIRDKWTMFVGIEGYRKASFRTGLDDGMDGPEFSDDGVTWYDYPFKAKPNFCRVGIWRKGVNRPFQRTLRMDSRYNENSEIWRKDAAGQLAKCTEALARRCAFPADMASFGDIMDVEDVDTGAPMTRAEVPEGQYREISENTSTEADPGDVKPLNLDADREKAAEQPAKAPPARKAPPRAKAPPAEPVAAQQPSGDVPPPEEPGSVQKAYDKAFAETRVAEFAGDPPAQEGDMVARPEPPQGEPRVVSGAPETKAQEMSKFWLAAKRFEKDTGKIIAASKEHFGAPPAELEGIRRVQLLHLLETGEPPAQDVNNLNDHEAAPAYTEDGVMVCETCGAELDEETGKHK